MPARVRRSSHPLPIIAAAIAMVTAAPRPPDAATAPVRDAALARAIDAYAKPLVARGDLSGQLLVARDGKIIVERNYGFADRELEVPIAATSVACIASGTKPMTLVVALKMMEQKKVGYRDPIARWLPDFPRGDSITIEHLLRHRSGIPHEIVPDSLATVPRTPDEMVERAKRLPLDFPPGSRSSYSTGGFTVLTRILEIASGKDYASLLDEYVFRPTGMTRSAHTNSVAILPGRVEEYAPGVRGVEHSRLADYSGLAGGGSVWSTARDMHRLAQGVISGALGASARASLLRGGKLEFAGRVGGFRSFTDLDSATGLEVTWVGNFQTGAAELLRGAVPQLAAGENVPPPTLPALSAAPMDEAALRRFEGDFALESGIRLALRVRSGALWANEWLLQPTLDGAFFSPRDYGLVRPIAGADGSIERLDWTQNGQVYAAPRVTGAR